MTTTLLLVSLTILTALIFDFTDGFHDSANAMATSVATGALRPRTAVIIAAILNVVALSCRRRWPRRSPVAPSTPGWPPT